MCQQNAAKCNAMCLKVFPLDVKMAYINKVSVHVSHISFPWAINLTLISKYWLVPGTDSTMISQSN